MSDGLIQTALDKLLSIINNEHLTNGFDTDNLKSKGKKDIVVSLADVNDHILKAKQELIAEIKTEIDNYIVYVIKTRMDEYNSSVLFATLRDKLLGTESETTDGKPVVREEAEK